MQSVLMGSRSVRSQKHDVLQSSVQPLHPQSVQSLKDAVHLSSLAFGASSPLPKSPSPSQRTRFSVFRYVMSRYIKAGIFMDMAIAAVVGGLIALGSPVFVVTFPATLAVLMGLAVVRAALFAKKNDPNGEVVDKMYSTWQEVDQAGGMFRWAKARAAAQKTD
jgi:hypothetical protein